MGEMRGHGVGRVVSLLEEGYVETFETVFRAPLK